MVGMIIILIVFTLIFMAPFVYINVYNRKNYIAPEEDDLKWYLKKDPQRQRRYLIEKYLGDRRKIECKGTGWTIAFKGFRKDMTCRGFHYKEGEVYKEWGEPQLCCNGFHACLFPRDCYNHYYHPTDVYHIVFLKELDTARDTDSKICGLDIKIGPEINRKYIQC